MTATNFNGATDTAAVTINVLNNAVGNVAVRAHADGVADALSWAAAGGVVSGLGSDSRGEYRPAVAAP